MIKSNDRSGYIGASDTKFVMGNWKTKTFRNWWMVKLGLSKQNFKNIYTAAGNNYEHKIIDALGIPNIEKDKQIIKGRLRVNLDANTNEKIHEIKTYVYENGFDISKHKDYWQQGQVQMYASGIHNLEIDAYGLKKEDYKNFFNEIDKDRILVIEIEYNEKWINEEFIPREQYLERCLELGKFPNEEEIMNKETIEKNELIKVENNELVIAEETINKIIELETQKKLIDEKEKELKQKLEEIMSQNDCGSSFESNDKRLKITYSGETTTTTFDTAKFKEENEEMYNKYMKPTIRKGSIRITVREGK